MFLEHNCVPDHTGMHLSQNYSTGLTRHVLRPDAVLDAIRAVTIFLHDTDAPSGQWDIKGTIAKPVVLAAKAQPTIRKESHCVDGLFKPGCVVVVLG